MSNAVNNAAVYLDNNGTTQMDSRVLESMLPYLSGQYGNATSRHVYGRSARQAIEQAREQIAEASGAHPSQVILTGSGTESNNLAITGIASMNENAGIAVSAIEHPCVSKPAFALQKRGWQVTTIDVNADGKLSEPSLLECLQTPTSLVSVMLANNETGVIQDIAHIAEVARQHHALVHTDAVQALGKVKVDFSDLNVHAMTLSSHKINGPQGAGALILDKRVDLQPLLLGGGQEKGLRSGSENVAAIVGFGTACELIKRELMQRTVPVKQMRDRLEQGLHQMGAVIFGSHVERLANTSFFAFPGIEGETLVMALDRKAFAVASGSACSSDSTEPSHVLLAMGIERDLARGAVRVSLSINNSMDEIAAFLLALQGELNRLKQLTAIAM